MFIDDLQIFQSWTSGILFESDTEKCKVAQ